MSNTGLCEYNILLIAFLSFFNCTAVIRSKVKHLLLTLRKETVMIRKFLLLREILKQSQAPSHGILFWNA